MLFHSNDVIRRNTITCYKRRLPLTPSWYFCQSKFVRKALKFLTSIEIPAFRCNLLLFKCFIYLSSLKLSARQTILETIILLFSVFIDSARVTIFSEISFGDLFEGGNSTCKNKNFWFKVSLSWFYVIIHVNGFSCWKGSCWRVSIAIKVIG